MSSLATALPGIYVAVLAAVMYLALARWFDTVPRRVIAVHATLVALLLGPHLVFGRTLLPVSNLRGCSVFGFVHDTSASENPLHDDLLVQMLPTITAVRAALARGELPLRDDSAGGGIPLWADQQAQILQPLIVASLPFPAERALVVTAALRLILALTFTFLFLRSELGSANGPLAGSLAFGLGGFVQLWLGWPLASTAAWLPVVLYAVRRVIDSARRRDAALLTFAAYGLLTAGHPETVAFAFAFTLGYAAFELARIPGQRRWRVALTVVLPLAIGAALTAPMNVPSLRAMASSERSLAVAFFAELRADRGEIPHARPARLASILAPEAFGNDRFGQYWGESNSNEDAAGYPGATALLLGILALGVARRERGARFLIAILGFCLLVIAACWPFGWIAWHAPILKSSSTGGHRLLLLVNWIMASLAARTVSRSEESPTRRRRTIAAASLLVVSIGAIYWLNEPENMTASIASRRSTIFALQLSVIVAATIASTMRSRRAAGVILVALVAIELTIAHRPANPAAKTALPNTPPLLAALRETADGWRVQASRPALRANLGSLYGIRQIEVYNPMEPASWFTIVVGIPDAATESARRDAEAWLDALGARFALRAREEMDRGTRALLADDRSGVIERTTALPLFRFAGKASSAPRGSLVDLLYLPLEQSRSAIARHGAELRDGVGPWLLADPPRGELIYVADASFWSDAWRPVEGDTIEVRVRSAARLAFDLHSRGPRLFATTEVDDGGWSALVDGKRVAIETVNGAFVGLRAPGGTSHVELRYRPPGFYAGIAAGLTAIGCAIVMMSAWQYVRSG